MSSWIGDRFSFFKTFSTSAGGLPELAGVAPALVYVGTLVAALVGLRNRKTGGELKLFRQTSALRTRVGIPSADRAGFSDCKTTQPRLRGALFTSKYQYTTARP